LLVGVLTMVWLLEIFSETPEFNFYKYFTLTENGLLTHHSDKMHDIIEGSRANDSEFTMTKTTSSSLNYKRHHDNDNDFMSSATTNTSNNN
jgi:hypothetical protein